MSMNISAINSDASSVVTKVTDFIKSTANWIGHAVKVGFEKLSESIKLVWTKALPFLKTAFAKTSEFVRTAPGLGVASFIGAAILGTWATATDNKWAAIAMKVGAGACLVGTGAAIGLGLAYGLKTQII